MSVHKTKLSPKKAKAIAALLEKNTIKEAALSINVGEATIFRWLQDPHFNQAFRAAKKRLVDHAVTRLQKASEDAVKTLRDIMTDVGKPPSVRVTAARIILEMSVKAVEIDDLTTRIENLELQVQRR